MRRIQLMLLTMLVMLSACTSVQVNKVDSQYSDMNHVCIERNDKVIVGDFLDVVQKRMHSHGISTEVYTGTEVPRHCVYYMTYTAFQNWDMAIYMHHAELRLFKGVNKIGYAEYHLKSKGGLALNKWASVESKMTPVIDELLANLKIEPTAPKSIENVNGFDAKSTSAPDGVYSKLSVLKKMREDGLITEQEYLEKKKELLNGM